MSHRVNANQDFTNLSHEHSSHHHIDENRFSDLMQKHLISGYFSRKLKSLHSFKIVFILDDSGSMNKTLDESPLNKGSFKATRWDELQEFIKISIEIANAVNPEGCDVYFLNRRMVKSVKKPEEIMSSFKRAPGGFTPITKMLSTVLKNNMPNVLNDKKLLVVIVTDGEPTNVDGKVDVKGFKECLASRPSNVFTTILACTDENDSMEYLNNWDKNIQRLDVVDDYRSEKKEIIRAQGSSFQFTYGDYVAKSLIGSTDPAIDNLDENKKGCCFVL